MGMCSIEDSHFDVDVIDEREVDGVSHHFVDDNQVLTTLELTVIEDVEMRKKMKIHVHTMKKKACCEKREKRLSSQSQLFVHDFAYGT